MAMKIIRNTEKMKMKRKSIMKLEEMKTHENMTKSESNM
jgi:hypothetical protein